MKWYTKRNAVGVPFKVRKDGLAVRARNRYRKSWLLKNVTFALATVSPTPAPPPTEAELETARQYLTWGGEYAPMPRQISPAALVAARANLAKAREMGQLEDVVEGLIQTLESEEEEVEWQQRLATDSQLRYKHNLKCVLHQWKEVVESRVGNFWRASMQVEITAVRYDAVRDDLLAKLQPLGSWDDVLTTLMSEVKEEQSEMERREEEHRGRSAAEGLRLKSAPLTGGVPCPTFDKRVRGG